MLSFYRKLLELRQFPAEEHRPRLAAYIAGLPGRLARLPRVEAIPKPGVSDYEVNTVVILSGTTSSGPIRVETQFLTHDVEKYTRLNEKVSVLLGQPTSTYTEQDSVNLCDWLLYEMRYASGCTMQWKSPPTIPVAPNSGHPDVPAADSAQKNIVDISGDSDHGADAAIFLGDPRVAPGIADSESHGEPIAVDSASDDATSPASRPIRARKPSAKAMKAAEAKPAPRRNKDEA